jgi:hypothetical protein
MRLREAHPYESCGAAKESQESVAPTVLDHFSNEYHGLAPGAIICRRSAA